MNTRKKGREILSASIGKINPDKPLDKRVCIYTTGSFGRSDASQFSDLDVFLTVAENEIDKVRDVSRLEEIEVLACVIQANRELGLPPLDNDGGFLKIHSKSDFLVGLGKPIDDQNNTFTGRILLLLESEPLFGDEVYNNLIDECIARYWTDYADYSDKFVPAFLVNDILRFWRTLCVSYEAGDNGDPSKRRAKNYKLKFSRVLTCFSAIIGLHDLSLRKGTVAPEDAIEIIRRNPHQRLELVANAHGGAVQAKVDEITQRYDDFLGETNCSKVELYDKMSDRDHYGSKLSEAREYGDAVYELLHVVSEQSGKSSGSGLDRFLRYLTV